eukprot:1625635-Rhodomonas_salina.2
MQTAGALLDRPLQHMQVTSGRGVAWHTTTTANTVYDPDQRREKSVGSAGEVGGNWQRARPLRAWGSRRPRLGARHVGNWIAPLAGAGGDCRWRW